LDELFAGPRIGVVRKVGKGFELTGTGFRAFRGPTMNELYRTGQVGQQTTQANDALLAERATGFEFGGEESGRLGRLRATYFWTEVNRPISAVLLSETATTQLLQRQNLGQIRSRGVMVEGQTTAWRGLDASFGYQLAVATVTAFNSSSAAQANLTGKWIPEVPRESVTATVNYVRPKIASLHVVASYEGREFDDAANEFLLHPYARVDVMAERQLGHGFSVYAGAQNVLNRTIDAGETPVLTLAAPRLVQGGLRYELGRARR
jgi:outer membrane receptor protein involved in Fe transport